MGSFKDLFFVSEDKQAQQVATEEPAKIKKEVFSKDPMSSRTEMSGSEQVSDQKASVPSEDMVSKIWDQIISRNLPGPDYLELRNNASALEDLPLTEEQRIEAAFKVLKQTYPNLSKQVILNSIDTYLAVVEEERAAGLEECKKVRMETVGEKESRLKVMRETNAETQKQIEELKKRFEETNDAINKMEHEILTATQTLDSKERMFNASVDSARQILLSDKNKISTLNI